MPSQLPMIVPHPPRRPSHIRRYGLLLSIVALVLYVLWQLEGPAPRMPDPAVFEQQQQAEAEQQPAQPDATIARELPSSDVSDNLQRAVPYVVGIGIIAGGVLAFFGGMVPVPLIIVLSGLSLYLAANADQVARILQ